MNIATERKLRAQVRAMQARLRTQQVMLDDLSLELSAVQGLGHLYRKALEDIRIEMREMRSEDDSRKND